MSEINKEPQEVSEIIDAVLTNKDTPTVEDFLDKVGELKRKHQHRAYDVFKIGFVKSGQDVNLVLHGTRKENPEELKVRVEKETAVKESVDNAELKEYLRLKKKFDKAQRTDV